MAYLKTQEEQDAILKGGLLLGAILEDLGKMAKPGVTTLEIDTEAERRIRAVGGIPAFKGYAPSGHRPFPGTICACVNDEIVHGIPSDRVLIEGQILSIDIGMQYPAKSGLGQGGNGFFTDTAITVPVGEINSQARQLLSVTKKSLEMAIEVATAGTSVAEIGRVIERYIEPQGYGIVRDLVGHGVGHEVHEDPAVPNYYEAYLEKKLLKPGVVIAIEPMITVGDYRTDVLDDGWTIVTDDGSLSAHFEHTIIITEDGKPIVATLRPSEK
ncbi:MAG: Methionine aminopeptidase [Candidatus Magasanikbacteria bacterium GW2011_GWD2_43_18]|uniref:Methionine aminopeptidase n=1 Tax=Candidatus Magasanikbacteria bacterium GW2011_GWE2_42_7 TaxID=1619052 RepID=A0A0G1BCV9_9BACT|nr:MAG: Methionine aminopeptidase [Candidatus Magasanikbacteria bacterium GW2011_GWC2_42_27]KKS71122.1 MAG: Methionine aminopeptidase [Candidatus Magasanikbacteria bacterium GW2011_GWE2_42_7]KKT04281.1 MAG: Methionine aminopeptidase [Candidatus Magasanikbacteria bacterium GW2011_GWD2_43_18]HBB38375.1 type I methionyl aminopeptidase [Candidatus Magasanikbacteria bacterium]HCC14143.1 type I methionyl aminopeptidase [Candidatus Magasanikbacteria bacterium]